MPVLSTYLLMRRRYIYVFLSPFFFGTLSFLCPLQLLPNNIDVNNIFLQAEYALMEDDSIQADLIFRYLAAQPEKSRFTKLSLMRLFSRGKEDLASEIPLWINKKDTMFLQLILSGKEWEQRKKNGLKKMPVASDFAFAKELKKLSHLIKCVELNSPKLFTKEAAFFQKLIKESTGFQATYLKDNFTSAIHQETTIALLSFLYKETIDRLFLSELLFKNFPENSFYLEYRKYINLLELNRIKASFFREQFYLHSNLVWEKRLVETYDILFFLQNQILQKGLFNTKRKEYVRNNFTIQEQAILFYQDQYCLTHNKRWMQKILTAMENIKSSLLTTKSVYYNSTDLLKDLCRNVIAEIEKGESSPALFINANKQLDYIKQQMRISSYYKYFYEIHQHNRKDPVDVNLKKLRSICQQSKGDDMAVINFFDSKNYLFALFIDDENERLNIISKCKKDSLQEALQYLKKTYADPVEAIHANKTKLRNFQQSGNTIYRSILEPLFEKKIPNHLVIIPDGLLNYIPFEAFTVGDVSSRKRQPSYLVHHAAIRYYPSLKLFSKYEHGQNKTVSIKRIKAYAPPYSFTKSIGDRDKPLPQLPGGIAEINTIKDRFQIKNTERYSIQIGNNKTGQASGQLLHLAMHAASHFVHRNEPGLICSNLKKDILFLHDIARLPNVSSTVILSACDTGLGQYTTGEGLKSIGLQFLQAGAKSTIQNLAKATDASSFQLMDEFYEGLKKQEESHQALQKSKQSFLAKADAFSAHPYFWSGLVAYGQPFIIQQ